MKITLDYNGYYSIIKTALDKCHAEETELRQNFDLALEKMKKFIIANSLTPVTSAQLDNALQKKRNEIPDQCTGEAVSLAKQFIAQKPNHLANMQKEVDAMLATPRPPVMNPCL